jgi:trans-aconitate 3-methyltransferase
VATGLGQVAAELSTYFGKVLASDDNTTHVAIAKYRLRPLVSSQTMKLKQCSAEALVKAHPSSNIDLITAAECLTLVDRDKALAGFATMLKPNGTLAIWF